MIEADALEAVGVSYRVGSTALVDRVDLVVRSGELVALVGPNGAGKSTLCGLLAHDLTPSAGDVKVAGRPVADFRPRDLARARAVLPQRVVFGFPFSVRDVVQMGRRPHLRRGRGLTIDDERIAEDAMGATDVLHLADRPVTQLSGGEQMRVAFARVLTQRAPLLLLDEPTAALDLRHQQQILRTCRQLADDGTAVLAVLHDLTLAGAWADRIGVMQAGRIVAVGSPGAVLCPDVISRVFGEAVVVLEHPFDQRPVVVPAGCPRSNQPTTTPTRTHTTGAIP